MTRREKFFQPGAARRSTGDSDHAADVAGVLVYRRAVLAKAACEGGTCSVPGARRNPAAECRSVSPRRSSGVIPGPAVTRPTGGVTPRLPGRASTRPGFFNVQAVGTSGPSRPYRGAAVRLHVPPSLFATCQQGATSVPQRRTGGARSAGVGPSSSLLTGRAADVARPFSGRYQIRRASEQTSPQGVRVTGWRAGRGSTLSASAGGCHG